MSYNEWGEYEDDENAGYDGDIPMSPYEQSRGEEYDPNAENPYAGDTQEDIDVYESGGMEYPGPKPSADDGGDGGGDGGSEADPYGDLGDVPRDWAEDFISRNPGDYSRIQSAYGSDNFGDDGGEDEDIYGGSGTGAGQADYRGPFQGGQVKVGEDPFSQMLTGGYLDLLKNRGQTPFGGEMEKWLSGLLERGGEIDEDPSLYAQRMEAARQPIEAFRRMQSNQMRGELANRGLLSEPGQAQGAEISSLGRLEEGLAPWYSSAGQNLASQMAQEKGQRFDRALSLGTGFASQQAQDYLNTLRGGTERQGTLSDIALGTLDRNITWNKFLAEYGMSRDMALEAMQSGRTDDVNELLDMFQNYVNASREGYR